MKTTRKFRAALYCALAVSLCAGSTLADLPEGYTQLPFVKASGQCRVRTRLMPAGTDKAELTFELSTVSGNQNLWCSRSESTGQFTTFMIADKVRFDRYTNQVTTTAALVPAKKYTVTADYATGEGVVTDVAAGTTAASAEMDTDEYTPASELCLFASHTTDVETDLGNYGTWTFYSFKLRDADGNLRCDLVPARLNSDGVIGLYDTVRSTFLANDLDGELTLGTGYSFDDNGNLLVGCRHRFGNGQAGSVGNHHRHGSSRRGIQVLQMGSARRRRAHAGRVDQRHRQLLRQSAWHRKGGILLGDGRGVCKVGERGVSLLCGRNVRPGERTASRRGPVKHRRSEGGLRERRRVPGARSLHK